MAVSETAGSLQNYRKFFSRLTGAPQGPYPYQERLAVESLLKGRSVVLRAPTGAGKTWAVTAPFLYSLVNKSPIADQGLFQ